MLVDEDKYSTLFITKFKANEVLLKSEFERVIKEKGYSESIKLLFFEELFKVLIKQFKRDLPKDEDYEYIISTLYNYFISELKNDDIDTSKYKTELQKFKTKELSKLVLQQSNNTNNIPEYKAFNLNSKYGRCKAREQAIRNYENGSPEYRKDIDNIKVVVLLIIIVIAIIVWLVKQK